MKPNNTERFDVLNPRNVTFIRLIRHYIRRAYLSFAFEGMV